jgi:hypothetical protein
MVWLIILVALGFILGSILTLKYTANMKMHIPKELEHQYKKALHLDAGEHAKAIPEEEQELEQGYDNDYHNEYPHNEMPDTELEPKPEQNTKNK